MILYFLSCAYDFFNWIQIGFRRNICYHTRIYKTQVQSQFRNFQRKFPIADWLRRYLSIYASLIYSICMTNNAISVQGLGCPVYRYVYKYDYSLSTIMYDLISIKEKCHPFTFLRIEPQNWNSPYMNCHRLSLDCLLFSSIISRGQFERTKYNIIFHQLTFAHYCRTD